MMTALVLPRDTPRTALPILEEIAAERASQDAEWGGPAHDDDHTLAEWAALIEEHLDKAENAILEAAFASEPPAWRPTPLQLATWRRQLVIVAALATAALEAFDRQALAIPPKPSEAPAGAKEGLLPPCDVE